MVGGSSSSGSGQRASLPDSGLGATLPRPPPPSPPPATATVVVVSGIRTPCFLTLVNEPRFGSFMRTGFPPPSVTARAARHGGASTATADGAADDRIAVVLATAARAADAAAAANDEYLAATAAATGGSRSATAAAVQKAGIAANARAHASYTSSVAASLVLGGARSQTGPVQVGEFPAGPGHMPARPKKRRRKGPLPEEPEVNRAVPLPGLVGAGGGPAGVVGVPGLFGGPPGSAAAAAVAAAAAIVPANDAPLSPAARARMTKEFEDLGLPSPIVEKILAQDLTAPLPVLPPDVDRPAVLKVRTKQRNRKSAERSRAKTKHKTTVAKDAAAEVWRECQAVWELAMRLESTNRRLQAAVEYAKGAHATWSEVQRIMEVSGAIDGSPGDSDPSLEYVFPLGSLLAGVDAFPTGSMLSVE
ncbi:hypothetical protein BU14_0087s0001 [Porphyra umbilicalis]|uniref:BZIP domain-containing protein n=1 Tax=Porphyra umbilicalis TaxID=2786 RepID=A0A1X6PDV4_PORUM|nr:hypothetical protein BU14_0087s0001 [Porphyra umbilicalis]|eukprot:OSX79051.1 hypothetical protein BU14_0087s0001 [Porphyra umbilicalis]